MIPRLRSFAKDNVGSTAVEFAILAPVFISLLFGVFLTGIWLQNYNAVKSVASDTAREIAISYQRGNKLNQEEMRAIALSIAVEAPYLLESDSLDIVVDQPATSRVTGAKEYSINLSYQMTELAIVPMRTFRLDYARPIFVVD